MARPPLGTFRRETPDITVNVYTRPEVFSFDEQPMDVAIHFGSAAWMGCHGAELMEEAVVPLASPALLAKRPCQGPADLLRYPLLVLSCRPDSWENWLIHANVAFDFIHGPIFDQMEACAAAAVSGTGIALLPKFLFQREIDDGRLMVVFDNSMDSRLSYRVVWPFEKEDNPLRNHFVTWLLQEASCLRK